MGRGSQEPHPQESLGGSGFDSTEQSRGATSLEIEKPVANHATGHRAGSRSGPLRRQRTSPVGHVSGPISVEWAKAQGLSQAEGICVESSFGEYLNNEMTSIALRLLGEHERHIKLLSERLKFAEAKSQRACKELEHYQRRGKRKDKDKDKDDPTKEVSRQSLPREASRQEDGVPDNSLSFKTPEKNKRASAESQGWPLKNQRQSIVATAIKKTRESVAASMFNFAGLQSLISGAPRSVVPVAPTAPSPRERSSTDFLDPHNQKTSVVSSGKTSNVVSDITTPRMSEACSSFDSTTFTQGPESTVPLAVPEQISSTEEAITPEKCRPSPEPPPVAETPLMDFATSEERVTASQTDPGPEVTSQVSASVASVEVGEETPARDKSRGIRFLGGNAAEDVEKKQEEDDELRRAKSSDFVERTTLHIPIQGMSSMQRDAAAAIAGRRTQVSLQVGGDRQTVASDGSPINSPRGDSEEGRTSAVSFAHPAKSHSGLLSGTHSWDGDWDSGRFHMWTVWMEKGFDRYIMGSKSVLGHSPKTGVANLLEQRDLDDDDDDEDEEFEAKHRAAVKADTKLNWSDWQRYLICSGLLIVHPQAPWRVVWDMFSVPTVGYECVVIPLQFFELPDISLMTVLAWIVRIYWTLDLPMCFMTGFLLSDGKAEMRPTHVIFRYLKTWFIIDASMLAVDWLEVIMTGGLGGLNAARMGKTLKSIRMLRMVRLLKMLQLQKVPDFVKVLEHYFKSEIANIVGSIAKIIVFLIWLNHTIGCCWYGIGGEQSFNWMTKQGYDSKSMEFLYLAAMHWSFANFAGNVEIFPVSVGERIFCCSVLVFSFVIAAYVVSSITSSLTRLELATARTSEKHCQLKQFLFDHNISRKLAVRVQRNAQHAVTQQQRLCSEDSIELLSLISEPLRRELHYEINMPMLCSHPFLREYCEFCPGVLKQVCHMAVTDLALVRGDVLFREGEMSPHPQMYFVSSGRLHYSQIQHLDRNRILHVGQWACEAILWTPWVHCGSLRARTECKMMVLDAEAFQSVTCRSESQGLPAYVYGRSFVSALNDVSDDKLTDLHSSEIDLDDLVEEAFPALSGTRGSRKSSGAVLKRGSADPFVSPGKAKLERQGTRGGAMTGTGSNESAKAFGRTRHGTGAVA